MLELKIWRCHSQSARIIPAEKTLHGTANLNGVKWCGPYTSANKAGFWLFPPIDIDITWRGGQQFDYKFHEEYSDEDYHLVRQLIKPTDGVDPDKWSLQGGRTKFTWGLVEPGVVQMWTGLIFKTPPGWCLHVRSPVNFAPRSMYVMEGIIETDWMQYDIWTNLVFTKENETIQLRKDGWPPLAQLIPTRRETFAEKWSSEEEMINRDSVEANQVFEYWINYNHKKFGSGGKQALTPDKSLTKDGTTYHKEKMRLLGKNMEPKQPTVVYILNNKPLYLKMALNSIKMLQTHSPNIKIKAILIDSDIEIAGCEIIHRPWYLPEKKYFPLNKYWLHEFEEDEILYLDVDTFINGDVSSLFHKYNNDFTACENAWVWAKGWKAEFLEAKPWNSGVILFKNGYHRKLSKQLPEMCEEVLGTLLGQWMQETNPWVVEEMATSVLAAKGKSGYFRETDAYNIRRKEDVACFRETLIFHSYTQQWDLVEKLQKNRKKMIWRPIHPCVKKEQ